ncbi:PAS domain-containing protein [Methylobacterium sp. J-088]|nr:PAS domain-containing protein [Methylobacterium sp. J-088]
MPKLKLLGGRRPRERSKLVLGGPDALGFWTWDAERDRVWADTFVALLFEIDPEEAEAGVPLSVFAAHIHPPDQSRVLASFRAEAREDGHMALEYRVRATGGGLRLVLSRGRFAYDHRGRPLSGHGIIVDISDLQARDEDRTPAPPLAEDPSGTSLDRAATAAIAAFQAIEPLNDPGLTARAEALLFEIGRKLATQEADDERKRLN